MGFNSANRVDERKERNKGEKRNDRKKSKTGGRGSRNMTKVEPSEKLERRACERGEGKLGEYLIHVDSSVLFECFTTSTG